MSSTKKSARKSVDSPSSSTTGDSGAGCLESAYECKKAESQMTLNNWLMLRAKMPYVVDRTVHMDRNIAYGVPYGMRDGEHINKGAKRPRLQKMKMSVVIGHPTIPIRRTHEAG